MVDRLLADSNATVGDSACTDTFQRPALPEPLSKQFWNVDLTERLPRALNDAGVRAVPGELARVMRFISEHFPRFSEEAQGSATDARHSTVKSGYLQRCDIIELHTEQRTVGVIVGAPEDWSTYYVRVFAVASDFQKHALVRRFARECLLEPLAACGVQRVTAETSPSHRAMARLFAELDFHVTGQQLTDRWGPLVRYTKFLDPHCEARFLERFSGIAHRRI
jgi:hypothetical protein